MTRRRHNRRARSAGPGKRRGQPSPSLKEQNPLAGYSGLLDFIRNHPAVGDWGAGSKSRSRQASSKVSPPLAEGRGESHESSAAPRLNGDGASEKGAAGECSSPRPRHHSAASFTGSDKMSSRSSSFKSSSLGSFDSSYEAAASSSCESSDVASCTVAMNATPVEKPATSAAFSDDSRSSSRAERRKRRKQKKQQKRLQQSVVAGCRGGGADSACITEGEAHSDTDSRGEQPPTPLHSVMSGVVDQAAAGDRKEDGYWSEDENSAMDNLADTVPEGCGDARQQLQVELKDEIHYGGGDVELPADDRLHNVDRVDELDKENVSTAKESDGDPDDTLKLKEENDAVAGEDFDRGDEDTKESSGAKDNENEGDDDESDADGGENDGGASGDGDNRSDDTNAVTQHGNESENREENLGEGDGDVEVMRCTATPAVPADQPTSVIINDNLEMINNFENVTLIDSSLKTDEDGVQDNIFVFEVDSGSDVTAFQRDQETARWTAEELEPLTPTERLQKVDVIEGKTQGEDDIFIYEVKDENEVGDVEPAVGESDEEPAVKKGEPVEEEPTTDTEPVTVTDEPEEKEEPTVKQEEPTEIDEPGVGGEVKDEPAMEGEKLTDEVVQSAVKDEHLDVEEIKSEPELKYEQLPVQCVEPEDDEPVVKFEEPTMNIGEQDLREAESKDPTQEYEDLPKRYIEPAEMCEELKEKCEQVVQPPEGEDLKPEIEEQPDVMSMVEEESANSEPVVCEEKSVTEVEENSEKHNVEPEYVPSVVSVEEPVNSKPVVEHELPVRYVELGLECEEQEELVTSGTVEDESVASAVEPEKMVGDFELKEENHEEPGVTSGYEPKYAEPGAETDMNVYVEQAENSVERHTATEEEPVAGDEKQDMKLEEPELVVTYEEPTVDEDEPAETASPTVSDETSVELMKDEQLAVEEEQMKGTQPVLTSDLTTTEGVESAAKTQEEATVGEAESSDTESNLGNVTMTTDVSVSSEVEENQAFTGGVSSPTEALTLPGSPLKAEGSEGPSAMCLGATAVTSPPGTLSAVAGAAKQPVDAALAELDSLPDGACESGEVDEEEDEDEEWSYYRMEPQLQPQGEDLIPGATAAAVPSQEASLPEAAAEQVTDIASPAEDQPPTFLTEVPVHQTTGDENLEFKAEDIEDAIRKSSPEKLKEFLTDLENQAASDDLMEQQFMPSPDTVQVEPAQSPLTHNPPDLFSMEKSPVMETSPEKPSFELPCEKMDMEVGEPGSPHAPGSPRSVEGFVTSVELNTPEESFGTNFAVNQAQDLNGAGLDQQSGPFSVYVSSSPEPVSLDPTNPASTDLFNNELTNGQVDEKLSQPEVLSPVEIVHAQSTVEVVAPPSPSETKDIPADFLTADHKDVPADFLSADLMDVPADFVTVDHKDVPADFLTADHKDVPADLLTADQEPQMPAEEKDITFIPEPVMEPMVEVPVPVYLDEATPVSEDGDHSMEKPEVVTKVEEVCAAPEVPASPEQPQSPCDAVMEKLMEAEPVVETQIKSDLVSEPVEQMSPVAPAPVVMDLLGDVPSVPAPETVNEVPEVKPDTPVVEEKAPEVPAVVLVEAKSPPTKTAKTTKTPGKTPTAGKTTPSRTPSTKTPTSKAPEKKTPTTKPATRPTPTKTSTDKPGVQKPAARPTPTARTTTKPTTTAPSKPAASKPATAKPSTLTSRTTTKPATSKPSTTATTRAAATTKPATPPAPRASHAKPSAAAPKPGPARPTPSTRTTTTKRPVTAPTKPAEVNGTAAKPAPRPGAARPATTSATRKPLSATTAKAPTKSLAEKETKNTTNRILSTTSRPASKGATGTTRTTGTRMTTTTTSRMGSADTKTKVNGTTTTTATTKSSTTATTKSRLTTNTKTAPRAAGVAVKKTMVSKTKTEAKAKGVKAEVIETSEPVVNGENKIAEEETSVEVVEKLTAEEQQTLTTQHFSHTSTEQVITTEATEVMVNGNH